MYSAEGTTVEKAPFPYILVIIFAGSGVAFLVALVVICKCCYAKR